MRGSLAPLYRPLARPSRGPGLLTRIIAAGAIIIALPLFGASLSVSSLGAQENPYAGLARPDAARYKACIARTASDPAVALEAAELWLVNDGGVPAKHCLALALLALGESAKAAQWLEEAARDVAAGMGLDALGAEGGPDIRAQLLIQAGNAWMLGREYDRAHRALTDALTILPATDERRLELFMDRSRAAAGQGNWAETIEDLSQVLLMDDQFIEAYVMRAAARRRLGQFAEADEDLARALGIAPDNAEALLERGNLRRIEGDDAAARRDWSRVAELYPGTDEAEIALDSLELMRADP